MNRVTRSQVHHSRVQRVQKNWSDQMLPSFPMSVQICAQLVWALGYVLGTSTYVTFHRLLFISVKLNPLLSVSQAYTLERFFPLIELVFLAISCMHIVHSVYPPSPAPFFLSYPPLSPLLPPGPYPTFSSFCSVL